MELQRISIPTFSVYRSEVICPSIEKEATWHIKTLRVKSGADLSPAGATP